MSNKNLLYVKPAKTEYILYPKVDKINLAGWHIYTTSYPALIQRLLEKYNSEKGRESTALLSLIPLHNANTYQVILEYFCDCHTLPCDFASCSSSSVLFKE